MRDQGSPPLDSPPRSGYNIGRKGAATSGWPYSVRFLCGRNRHRAGWRFLRFTTMVTVYGPMCNVIRMSLTPSRVVWPTACRLCSARRYLTISDGLWQAPGLTAAGTAGIIAVERALRQAVGPIRNLTQWPETVTGQGGGFLLTARREAGIISVERALRQAVGPVKSNKSHRETVTWQSGGLCFLR